MKISALIRKFEDQNLPFSVVSPKQGPTNLLGPNLLPGPYKRFQRLAERILSFCRRLFVIDTLNFGLRSFCFQILN